MAKTGRVSDQYLLRLPQGLRDRVKRRADEQGRSMTSVIIEILEKEFPAMSLAEMVAGIVNTLEAAEMLYGETELDGHVNQAISVIAKSLYSSTGEYASDDTRKRLREITIRAEKSDGGS